MEYHSSVNIGGDPKSGLEIKKLILDMPFLRGVWSFYTQKHTRQTRLVTLCFSNHVTKNQQDQFSTKLSYCTITK